ncbi:MAG: nucleoside-diphosphate kinase [Neoaquamicrobium sediminum]|uniref:nucleoside-diphosphate kinase n=1 Tax=Neoaquamicrobium sediminum TaxID=1849104 RepID=UPI004037644F
MTSQPCILTTKDFTIVEVMRDRCIDRNNPLASILTRKIASAIVMFRDDIPNDVATMSSRVTFSVDGRDPDTRIISHDPMASTRGLFLPITTLRGLALLGLTEGEDFVFNSNEGVAERVVLEKVHYQPEAARRCREAMQSLTGEPASKLALRSIHGGKDDRQQPSAPNGIDDPGSPAT